MLSLNLAYKLITHVFCKIKTYHLALSRVLLEFALKTETAFTLDDLYRCFWWIWGSLIWPEVVGIDGQATLNLLQLEHPDDRILQAWNDSGLPGMSTAILASTPDLKTLLPILRPYEPIGSTRFVDFDTTRPTWKTNARKCHVSHVVADTGSWEQKMAQALEEMDEVVCYVKNHNLGFTIPYTLNGEEHGYIPDFIVRVNDGVDPGDLLNLLLEVSGEARKDKAAKVATARNLWTPAINNHGGFGRWAFLEITDPWDAQIIIRAFLRYKKVDGVGPLLRQAGEETS